MRFRARFEITPIKQGGEVIESGVARGNAGKGMDEDLNWVVGARIGVVPRSGRGVSDLGRSER